MAEKNNDDIVKLSYEQARDELVKVLTDLEAGSVTLDKSMELWERGELLAKHCQALLGGAKAKIDEALKDK
jgi:exodeoxyribonuclease VII small subunit